MIRIDSILLGETLSTNQEKQNVRIASEEFSLVKHITKQ